MKSGQPGDPSSHWTIAAGANQYYWLLGLLTIFHFVMSAYLPPAEDELYYWVWSRDLQFSYYDHPPMVALLIAISTKIFGNSFFGIRFFSTIASLAVLVMLRQLSPRSQILALVCFTPVFLFGSILMTPDVPLLFFWTCYLFWFVKVARPFASWSDDPVTRVYHPTPISPLMWVAGGVILGLGCLSKYSMFLALPCSFLALALRYRGSAWWKGYLLHCVIAAIVAVPLIIYNVQHDLASFRFQWGNAMAGSGFAFSKFFEYLGGQLLMVGALPFLMLPWILLWRPEIRDDATLDVLFYFFVPPLIFFLAQSFRTKLEANWGLVSYLAFWPLGQTLIDRSSFRTFNLALKLVSFVLPIAFSLALLVHLFSPLSVVPVEKDRMTRLGSQLSVAETAARDLKAMEPLPLFLANYQWVSYFVYQGVNAFQTWPAGRQSHFTMKPVDACQSQSVYFFNAEPEPGDSGPALSCFKNKTRIKTYDLVVRGKVVGQFYLDKYSKL